MLNDFSGVSIKFADEFEENLYRLSKKYRHIRSDVAPMIEQLQGGNFLGDRLAGMGEYYAIFKVRIKNSDIQKGKSAGYRLICQKPGFLNNPKLSHKPGFSSTKDK